MAYYNPVTAVQKDIANTIRGGLAEMGNRPLERSRLNLEEAKMLYEIGRNKLADERAGRRLDIAEGADVRAGEAQTHNILMDTGRNTREIAAEERNAATFKANAPVRAFNQKKAKVGFADLLRQEKFRDAPLTMDFLTPMLFGSDPSRESIMDFTANKKLQKLMTATGGRLDKNGRFIKKNGQVATGNDLPRIMAIAQPILRADSDPGHRLNQQIREYEDFVKKDGGAGSPEDEAWYEQAKNNQKDPRWLIGEYEKQKNMALDGINTFRAMGLSTKLFENNLARYDKKIAKQEGTLSARAKHANAIQLQKIKSAGQLIGTLEKDATFLQIANGKNKDGSWVLPIADATNIVRSDKQMAQSIRGAAEELKILDTSTIDSDKLPGIIDAIKKSWGIDSASLKKRQVATKQADPNPDKLEIKELLFK